MWVLRYLFGVACLLSSTIAMPSIRGQSAPFIGPPTRNQRLEEGWIDEEAKYFHEPGTDDSLGHYDIRYFKDVVSYEERTETLRHMIRAYLKFFHEHGLETWIAHGTLLGWWWNGQILPWDWDVDTQVSGVTLDILRKHYNQTRHLYSPLGDATSSRYGNREYLLDVNSMSWERVRGDGMNIIDARWIDTSNGLYIDITGLSDTDPKNSPGIVSCKNLHYYNVSDLYPLRETNFEGVPSKVPYAYDKLLVEEYQSKALVLTEYEGHLWDSNRKLWLKRPSPSKKHKREPMNFLRKRSERK